jgi:hypothetical protein
VPRTEGRRCSGRTIDSGCRFTKETANRGWADLAERRRACGSPMKAATHFNSREFLRLPSGFHLPRTLFAKGAQSSPTRSYCEHKWQAKVHNESRLKGAPIHVRAVPRERWPNAIHSGVPPGSGKRPSPSSREERPPAGSDDGRPGRRGRVALPYSEPLAEHIEHRRAEAMPPTPLPGLRGLIKAPLRRLEWQLTHLPDGLPNGKSWPRWGRRTDRRVTGRPSSVRVSTIECSGSRLLRGTDSCVAFAKSPSIRSFGCLALIDKRCPAWN